MKENRYDRITDLIKNRLGGVTKVIQDDFKGVNPYRMEKKTPTDTIAEYLAMSDNDKQFVAQSFPDAWAKHEAQVQNLIMRRQK
jgi:hypothetical protein